MPIDYFPPSVQHVILQIASFTSAFHSMPGCARRFSLLDQPPDGEIKVLLQRVARDYDMLAEIAWEQRK